MKRWVKFGLCQYFSHSANCISLILWPFNVRYCWHGRAWWWGIWEASLGWRRSSNLSVLQRRPPGQDVSSPRALWNVVRYWCVFVFPFVFVFVSLCIFALAGCDVQPAWSALREVNLCDWNILWAQLHQVPAWTGCQSTWTWCWWWGRRRRRGLLCVIASSQCRLAAMTGGRAHCCILIINTLLLCLQSGKL